MSARACSLRNAPGLRYPDVRTLVMLCRMLGAELLGSDKTKWGATRHPFREVCAADPERSQCSALRLHLAPRPASDRRSARVSDILCRSGRVLILFAPARRAENLETRAEPASTLPLPRPDLRIRTHWKLPSCHPKGLFHKFRDRPGRTVSARSAPGRWISSDALRCARNRPHRGPHHCECRSASP